MLFGGVALLGGIKGEHRGRRDGRRIRVGFQAGAKLKVLKTLNRMLTQLQLEFREASLLSPTPLCRCYRAFGLSVMRVHQGLAPCCRTAWTVAPSRTCATSSLWPPKHTAPQKSTGALCDCYPPPSRLVLPLLPPHTRPTPSCTPAPYIATFCDHTPPPMNSSLPLTYHDSPPLTSRDASSPLIDHDSPGHRRAWREGAVI